MPLGILIFFVVIGLLFIIQGILIWKKEKINLIHSYHYQNVSKKDRKIYTQYIGKAIILIGFGILATGTINYLTERAYGWILFGLTFIVSLGIIYYAQKKYNEGMFS